MANELVRKTLSKGLTFSILVFLMSLNLTFNPNGVNAQTISYPAQVTICDYRMYLSVYIGGPTCAAVMAAIPDRSMDTAWICTPDIGTGLTLGQYVSCSYTRTYPGGYIYRETDDYLLMRTYFTCPYGPPPIRSFLTIDDMYPHNCELGATDIIPTKNLGNNSICDSVGNPVHPGTGNKSTIESDYNFASFNFIRYYNSQQNKLDRNIGIQWRHSYSARLVLNSSATPPITFAERPDGQTIFFRLNGGLWVGDGDISDELIEVHGSGWQLITSDDTIETYNTAGKLLSIASRDGRTQTLGYDANGRLITVTDDVGRALGFTYDGSSRIQTMTDPAGGVFQYSYDTTGNLTSVTYPDGKTRTYHYNEQAYTSNANLPNALTGITDENGVRYATYTYDTQGRAVVTEHAEGADRHVLGYSTDGSNTIVTDPLGSQYTHYFQTILGVAKSTGQSQRR